MSDPASSCPSPGPGGPSGWLERPCPRIPELRIEFRRCRISTGLTQVELARRSGVSQSTMSRIERGNAPAAAMLKGVKISNAMERGSPFGFCPQPHFCSWSRLDEDGTQSRDPYRPVASDEYLEAIRTGRTG